MTAKQGHILGNANFTSLRFDATRLAGNPIIRPGLDRDLGTNINGPSLIKVPDWLPAPLGAYYLYFAHHSGRYIRLAYSDALEGPWRVFGRGTLQLHQTPVERWSFRGHIASPDVHIDHQTRRIVMFYHGGYRWLRPHQATWVAESADGLGFAHRKGRLGGPYWRGFHWNGRYYAITMSGQLYVSAQAARGYRPGPRLSVPAMRHPAVWVDGDQLHLFFSRVGDMPERILVSSIDLGVGDWQAWHPSEPQTVLFPQEDYEGAKVPVAPSAYGAIHTLARQLRDPFVFVENDAAHLLYAVGGENGIGIARLHKTQGAQ